LNKLQLMTVFHTVARHSSFTQAAKELGTTVSAVSKHVHQLEKHLGTRLLNRTTRSQSLTDAGKEYLSTTDRLLTELQEIEERIANRGSQPAGHIRLTAPTALGQFWLSPLLPRFTARYPLIRLELVLDDQLREITKEGFDLALRTKAVSVNSSLYSQQLGEHRRRLVASPEYVQQSGIPQDPEQLPDYALLAYSLGRTSIHWKLSNSYQEVTVNVNPQYTANNYFALYQAALSGTGIASLYDYLVDKDIASGHLVEVLPEWTQPSRPVFGVYQQRRTASPKLNVLWHFLEEIFAGEREECSHN